MKSGRSLGKTASTPAPAIVSMSGHEGSSEERLSRIAESAYYKAEARGFAPGYEIEDWLAAEAEEKSWQLH